MNAGLSRIVVLGLLVASVLAAGAVLVSGYVNKPDHVAQVLAEDQCDDCPLRGTDCCCKAAGPCEGQACPAPCAPACGTCEKNKPADSCRQMTEAPGSVECPCDGGGCDPHGLIPRDE